MWGTIVWIIEYKRGNDAYYRILNRSGTDEESIRAGLLESAKLNGWKIVKIEEMCNTFENPK